jgi:hypoxanthine phosphoribosyltransferase
MVSHEEIKSRVQELAQLIHKDYEGSRPVMLCTLKGACPVSVIHSKTATGSLSKEKADNQVAASHPSINVLPTCRAFFRFFHLYPTHSHSHTQFYQHLLDALQELKHGYTMEFLRASSYDGTSTTGTVQVLGSELQRQDIENRHVILVEDIVDTGTTIAQLIPKLQSLAPKSVEVCTLLDKRLENGKKAVAAVAKKAKYVGFSIPNKFIIGYGLDYNELYRDLKDIWVITQAGIDFDARTLY